MQPWEAVVTTVLGAGGGAIILKLGEMFFRRTADVAKTGLKERSRRVIKDIELSGEAQKDIAAIAQWTMRELKASQDETVDLYGKIASLETANNALRSAFDKMKVERDVALVENANFIKQIAELITQSKDLSARLVAREKDFALLSIEHEGAKARIEKFETTVREMTAWIAEAQQREAELEAENERLRTRE